MIQLNIFQEFSAYIHQMLQHSGLPSGLVNLIITATIFAALGVISLIAYWFTKNVIIALIEKVIRKSDTQYDDFFLDRKVIQFAAHLIPAIIFYYTAELAFIDHAGFIEVVKTLAKVYIVVTFLRAADAFIEALHDIYQTMPDASERSIKGYIQIAKIIIYFVGGLLIISIVFKVQMTAVFTGLGAIAAVLLLVFKDTIMGLVAGIQLSANKMLKLGDWLEMPKYNADGIVTEISLNTVKVQNWDKTITTIPTYSLVSESFKNWRGMIDSGGRRMKRSINIDMNSVKFLSSDEINKFKKIPALTEFIAQHEAEMEKYANSLYDRKLTNLCLFMEYLRIYLDYHPKVHQEMSKMVRHLQPTELGIPVEITAFSNDTSGSAYEAAQAEILDYILASMNEFGLYVFQRPSGRDAISNQ